MAKSESNRITSCTIFWENTEDILSVVTKVFQTEIQVRFFNSGNFNQWQNMADVRATETGTVQYFICLPE